MPARLIPKISVAIPVYNGGAFISECIESILTQAFRDFKLIITEDNSVDATPRICNGYAQQDSRVRYIRNDDNIGAAAHYSRGSPSLSTISRLIPHLLSPMQMGRYALEVASMVSPQAAAWAKSRRGGSPAV